MDKELKKALLIFAKQPVPGRVKTRLVPPLSNLQAAELYRSMLEDVLSWASSLPDVKKYIFYDGGAEAPGYFAEAAPGLACLPQRGKDLGERMAEAFRETFAMGHAQALIIGTDSPDLPSVFIEEAFARLQRGECDAVFGPTMDGGYYLVGMSRLHRELFSGINWSSAAVLRESLERADSAGVTTSLLPQWYDVDGAEDLRRPGLMDDGNRAPKTREFLLALHRSA